MANPRNITDRIRAYRAKQEAKAKRIRARLKRPTKHEAAREVRAEK